MKHLAIALTAVSGLALFAPSSEAQPRGHGYRGHHHHHPYGHRAFGGRHQAYRDHLRRGYRHHHRQFRGYRGIGFRPASCGVGRPAYTCGY